MHASHAEHLAYSPLRERYRDIRNTTLHITSPFSAEDLMLQSMPDASPAKWHLAHTTWFFETFILSPHVSGYKPSIPASSSFSILITSSLDRILTAVLAD